MERPSLCVFLVLALLAIFLAGCGEKPADGQQAADWNTQKTIDAGKALVPEPQKNAGGQQAAKVTPKPSETATKIYIGLRQAGIKEAVVDVQRKEVVIGFMEDPKLSNEALAYYSFGLSAKFEPAKEKTSVLIFRPGGEKTEASVNNFDTIALSKGGLTDAQYKQKVRWLN